MLLMNPGVSPITPTAGGASIGNPMQNLNRAISNPNPNGGFPVTPMAPMGNFPGSNPGYGGYPVAPATPMAPTFGGTNPGYGGFPVIPMTPMPPTFTGTNPGYGGFPVGQSVGSLPSANVFGGFNRTNPGYETPGMVRPSGMLGGGFNFLGSNVPMMGSPYFSF